MPSKASSCLPVLGATLLGATLLSCGGGGGGGPTTDSDLGPQCAAERTFAGTWEGIQEVVFARHGCTEQACHGSGAQGGLDLSPQVAYDNLVDVPSSSSRHARVLPGDKDRSYLWLKLAAKTFPGTVEIALAPMPNGLPAISPDELELLRLWIYAGAPREGTVEGTQELLGACLPEPKPITIKPLDPPPPGEGVQLVMPAWRLPAGSEYEVCFASYYDVTEQVPEEFKDLSGLSFRWSGQELRQDPQSHHLILNYALTLPADLHDPSFGDWTCKGGTRDGEACEPTDLTACGPDGVCGSAYREGFGCIGFGPESGGVSSFQIGGAQQSQAETRFYDGVFAQIPLKGVLYWNSHAFNLTGEDHTMHARINFDFAGSQVHPVQPIFDASHIFAASAGPYTTQTVCDDHVLPQGARLFSLSSHTHKHGKHFTVDLSDGTRIYESFIYNDPVEQKFDPPLAFDSSEVKDRTLRYCSLYNNGLKEDGSPDPETVTRASRVPHSAQRTLGRCKPIACTAGTIGATCDGTDDDATCDSSPGAGDGECDACRITGGESTENEMFILIGQYYVAAATDRDAARGSPPAAGEGRGGDDAGHAGHGRGAGDAG